MRTLNWQAIEPSEIYCEHASDFFEAMHRAFGNAPWRLELSEHHDKILTGIEATGHKEAGQLRELLYTHEKIMAWKS